MAVVNKVNTIDNEFRNFEVEVIAKRDETKTDQELMIVDVFENKCHYKFDFSKVYWNSRLSSEHERMIKKFNKKRDVIFDIFAGVGPFSIPAAKAKCRVYANDLNPESIKWLDMNIFKNKIDRDKIKIFNMDAKEFITNDLKENLLKEYKRLETMEDYEDIPDFHFIMNLPALACDFLPHFIGLLNNDENTCDPTVHKTFLRLNLKHIVHCYCFLKGKFEDPKGEVRKLIEEKMGRRLIDSQILEIFRVRNVAPYKEMYRMDFLLTESILFNREESKEEPDEQSNSNIDNNNEESDNESNYEPLTKKQKTCKII